MITWQIARRGEKQATHPCLLSRVSGELVIDEVTMNDSEGKQYLIEHGVLRKRAMKWRRVRQYGYSAECWQRHEKKEADQDIRNLWKSIVVVCQAASELAAYDVMPLKDRTRYEKILSMPRPLTRDEWDDASQFVKAWKKKANQCE